jgi:hypothetical protein
MPTDADQGLEPNGAGEILARRDDQHRVTAGQLNSASRDDDANGTV